MILFLKKILLLHKIGNLIICLLDIDKIKIIKIVFVFVFLKIRNSFSISSHPLSTSKINIEKSRYSNVI